MQTETDKNLMVVAAIQGYAHNHRISEAEAYEEFRANDMFSLIRGQYDALHTQPLDETVGFAEDVLRRRRSGRGQ